MENLKQYIDIHKGKIAFVLGSGPSLRNLNTDMLKPHITIAVNASVLKVPSAEYYFSCDTGWVLYEAWHQLKNLKGDIILASNSGFGAFESRIGRKVFEGIVKERIHYIGRKKDNIIDKGERLIKGSSSVHPAVHFAYVLGCLPIVLLGCDCKYVEGKKHFTDFPNQPSNKLLKPEYNRYRRPLGPDNPGGVIDGELSHHLKVWKDLKASHLNIIDASEGNLNCFRQMSLEEVLKRYGKS